LAIKQFCKANSYELTHISERNFQTLDSVLRGQVNHGGHVPYNTYSVDHDRGFSPGTTQHEVDRQTAQWTRRRVNNNLTALDKFIGTTPAQHRKTAHIRVGRHFFNP